MNYHFKEIQAMETNREKCIAMLDYVPESKLGYVLAFICGLIVSDAADKDSIINATVEQMKEG